MRALGLILVLTAVLLTAAVYERLPSDMPTHWNAAGEVDDTIAKPWGPFLIPLLMAGSALLFMALPKISPRGFVVDASSRGFKAIVVSTLFFLFVLHCATLAFALGHPVSIPVVIPMLVGALFVVLGNYLGKVPRNFFIGVRTPWTLADDHVWFRTHRLAGWMFVVAGVFVLAAVPFAGERRASAIVLAAALTAALIPAVYSYVIYPRKGASE